MTEASLRPPKQRRSRRSLERVLDASTRLLEENGFEAFTIQDVSQRAEVSVGAIYSRFGNKENLLRVVHRHAMEAMETSQRAAVAAANGPEKGPREVVADAIAMIAGVFRTNERLLRAFMHLGAVDEEISRRGSQGSIDLARHFASTLLAHREAISHRSPEVAVDVAYRMAYCTFARQVMYGPEFESDQPIAWDDLVREVSDACAAYLLQGAAG